MSADTECPHIARCPIFARFRQEGVRNHWIGAYCRGSLVEECARKRLRDSGQPVPVTLLPNGRHLAVLDH